MAWSFTVIATTNINIYIYIGSILTRYFKICLHVIFGDFKTALQMETIGILP